MCEAVDLIRKALEQLEEDAEGWFQLGTVGQRLNNLSSEFDTRTFGHAKLSDLVEATGRFEINRAGQHVRLRPKPGRRRKGYSRLPRLDRPSPSGRPPDAPEIPQEASHLRVLLLTPGKAGKRKDFDTPAC